jgi:hypothetical protein
MNTKRIASACFVLVIVIILASCPNPNISDKGNSLTISINNAVNARTLLPPLDMNAASFTVNGTGPGGASFSQTTSGGPVTVTGLAFGSWSVTVNALNSAGTIIGSGQATVTVHTGQTTAVAISVVPLAGNGTLDISVTWTTSQVEFPSIQASLMPPSGTATPLSFSLTGNQATFSSTTIPAGYQTLTVRLLDNGIAVMGAVEVVRIVAGQTTTGSYAFTNVNQPGGSVVVNITPAMADPIPVSISGVPSTITAGTSVTATASVSDGTGNLTYVWYLNGVSQTTGSSSYTFGSALAAGYYRLDVTAYTADGTRAGSTTASFQVTGSLGPGPQAQWARTLTAGDNFGAFFRGVATDASDNLYCAGSCAGTTVYGFGSGVTSSGVSSGNNVLLVKYNAAGQAQWARTLTSGNSATFQAVAADRFGGICAVGSCWGTAALGLGNGVTAYPNAAPANSSNVLLVKYDSVGLAQWARTLAGTSDFAGFSGVAVDGAGNIYAAGYVGGTATYDLGSGVSATGTADTNVLLVKYDSAGNTIWAKTLTAGTPGAYFDAVAVDGLGNIYAAGYTSGAATYEFGSGVTATGTAAANTLLVKYDSAGNAVWARTLTSGADGAYFLGGSVAADSSGNVYAAGEIVGTGSYGFGNGIVASGSSTGHNSLLVKYDSSGSALWARSVTGAADTALIGIGVDPSGNVVASGWSWGAGTVVAGPGVAVAGSSSGGNVLALAYSSSGQALWARTLTEGTADAYYQATTVGPSGAIYCAGSDVGEDRYGFGNGVTATGSATGSHFNVLLVKYH